MRVAATHHGSPDVTPSIFGEATASKTCARSRTSGRRHRHPNGVEINRYFLHFLVILLEPMPVHSLQMHAREHHANRTFTHMHTHTSTIRARRHSIPEP